MPWHRYRPIFLTQQRIDGGVAFWREHAALLARAEREHGVPASIITATFPMSDAETAFRTAADRARSVKVQLSFAEEETQS